ncbi:MAG: hypothetical protein F6K16_30630 [Symploca sp. SIO2B6]|nr:hypothetical protein [Symploca sp. SIO2B6]
MAIATPTNPPSSPTLPIFSGRLLIRYRICLAYYYYTYHTNEPDLRYLPPHCTPDINREILVQRAWRMLEQAQKHIDMRLRKYVIINEISQATFHPHYILLAQIAILQAKLLLFFSRFVPGQDQASALLPTDRFVGQQRTKASTHWGQLYLAEKARLYAAADGDSERYACYAATQCWLHLMTAYADPTDLHLSAPLNSPNAQQGRVLSLQKCRDWAKTLRDHALISYADIGRRYYYQMKEKSGLPRHTSPDPFGPYDIERMPAIYEARGHDYDRLYQQFSQQFSTTGDDLWVWDMALLTVNPDYLPRLSPKHPKQTIYLFGTSACYLFFARGLYLLCSDRFTEFTDGQKREILPVEIRTDPRRQWDYKLNHATRLLNLAWAIAEEGCQIQRSSDHASNATSRLRITRPLSMGDRSNEYSSPEVNSVRDLYPHRINEIADLGKIFAATCLALRLYTVASEQHPSLVKDIQLLLNTLHGETHLTPIAQELIAGQPRYNGHLAHHFTRIKRILLDFIGHSATSPEQQSRIELTRPVDKATSELGNIIAQHRQTLLQKIFSTILYPYP